MGEIKKRKAATKKKKTDQAEAPVVKSVSENKPKKNKKAAEKPTKKAIVINVIRNLIFSASLGVFAFAASGLFVILFGYYISQREYKDLNDHIEIGVNTSTDSSKAPETETDSNGEIIEISPVDTNLYIPIKVDDEYYKAVNSDYRLYLYVPGTAISYPVVQGEIGGYYLRYTFKRMESTAGAISLDYRTNRENYLSAPNTVLLGHNRQDGSMFSDLSKYADEGFRDKNPYIYVIMDGEEYVYEIYTCAMVMPSCTAFNPRKTLQEAMTDLRTSDVCYYYLNPELDEDARVITLYTCNEDSRRRYVVCGKLAAKYKTE